MSNSYRMCTMVCRILLFVLSIVVLGSAQSLLSLQYPFGLPTNTVSGTALSMGGAAAGLPDDFHLLRANPANLGTIDRTIFSGLATVDFTRVVDDDEHSNHAVLTPRQISFSVPVGIIGNLGFSLAKETQAALEFETGPIDLDGGYIGMRELERRGGVTSWLLGWGRSINQWVYLGLAYERAYVTINSTSVSRVQDFPSAVSRDSSAISFGGNGIRFGFLAAFEKIGVGLAYNYMFEGDLDVERSVLRNREETEITEGVDSTGSLQAPPRFTVGLSYQFSQSWAAALDIGLTQWGQYASDKILEKPSRENAASFSAGVRFIPAPGILAPAYWQTIHYRGGAWYSQLPDESSNAYALSLGVGLPLNGGGLIDIIVEAGQRRDDRYDDYREDFASIGVGFNGGRSWQQATEFGE